MSQSTRFAKTAKFEQFIPLNSAFLVPTKHLNCKYFFRCTLTLQQTVSAVLSIDIGGIRLHLFNR